MLASRLRLFLLCAQQMKLSAVCHEQKRELLMLYQRWELASRSRLAGVGFNRLRKNA